MHDVPEVLESAAFDAPDDAQEPEQETNEISEELAQRMDAVFNSNLAGYIEQEYAEYVACEFEAERQPIPYPIWAQSLVQAGEYDHLGF